MLKQLDKMISKYNAEKLKLEKMQDEIDSFCEKNNKELAQEFVEERFEAFKKMYGEEFAERQKKFMKTSQKHKRVVFCPNCGRRDFGYYCCCCSHDND